MINSIYGKTMENLRKRVNVRLINNAKDYEKYGSKSIFLQETFSEKFVAIHETKSDFTLNKTICVGFSILHLSKCFTYDVCYNYAKKA